MDLAQWFQPGDSAEIEVVVEAHHTAQHLGEGAMRVLSTPVMIGLMENTSHRLLARHLPEGYSSVGQIVHVRHLAPALLGSLVRIRTEVLQLDGLRATFQVEAWQGEEQIGAGQHQRMVIELARYYKRLSARLAEMRREN